MRSARATGTSETFTNSTASRYIFAVAVVSFATLLRFVLVPYLGEGVPFILYFPAVLLCAWFGGLWPGLFSSALSAVVAWYLFIPIRYSFEATAPFATAQTIVFIVAGTLISLLAESLHRARARAAESETMERVQRLELFDSRERLRMAMEAGEMGTWTRELDGTNRVRWSPELEKIFGLEPGEFPETEEAFFDFIHPDDREPLRQAVAEAIETRTDYDVEFRYTRKGSGERWMIGRGMAFYDHADKPFRLAGIGWDITNRKRAEERFRVAVEAAPNAFAMIDREGKIALINSRAEQLFGYPRDELIGRSVELLIPPRLRSHHPDFRAAFLAEPRAREMGAGRDLFGLRRDGSEVPIEIGLNPIELDGKMFVLSSIVDITERKHSEEERALLLAREQAARAEAEAASRANDQFLAMVSHELRSPLTAILGWIRLMGLGQLEGTDLSVAIETIERSAKMQAQLVDDLLDVSSIITGKLRIAHRPVDLGFVIQSAIEAIRPATLAKSIRLDLGIDAGTLLVMGDATRLQQVIWNLLSNAVKFTPREGRIAVRLERNDSAARITVSDTGLGISPEFLPHVFERLKQADRKPTEENGGLGLGLAIARELVQMHGGTIEAESAGEGSGATFRVSLPLRTKESVLQ